MTSMNKIRRNVHDKLRLIKMVNDNRILWDSRLPNFKGAEEEKSHAWQLIGNEFGVPGRRVARAFKSLRESYRRELALVKTMGEGFQSKWGLFVAMDFLREVIRERKSTSAVQDGNNTSLNKSSNNNNSSSNNHNHNSSTKSRNRSSISLSDDYAYYIKSEPVDNDIENENDNANDNDNDNENNPDNHISSTLNGNYEDIDDMTSEDSNQVRRRGPNSMKQNLHNGHGHSHHQTNPNNDVEELEAIDADFPYPLIIGSNSPPSPMSSKRKRHSSSSDDDMNGYEQNLQQQQQQQSSFSASKIQPTVREVLNSKFCGFITAKLNSMDDSEADNLMNRILMLLVQTQVVVNGNANNK